MASVLMLLAVPLSRLRPRQGRFGRIGIAVLVYFMYYQLLIAAKAWIEGGSLNPTLRAVVDSRDCTRRCGLAADAAVTATQAASCDGGRAMSLLARYLMRSILGYTAHGDARTRRAERLVSVHFTQQDDIGVGTFTTPDALWFVVLNLPKYAFDMLPIAALIAALLSLGNLARSMELIVIRAAGISRLSDRFVGRLGRIRFDACDCGAG